jgi:hypothetical protein
MRCSRIPAASPTPCGSRASTTAIAACSGGTDGVVDSATTPGVARRW